MSKRLPFWVATRAPYFRCARPPRGWRCYLPYGHEGPCLAYPTRWNLRERWRQYRIRQRDKLAR
jgi:hypothetical protein